MTWPEALVSIAAFGFLGFFIWVLTIGMWQ